MTGLQLEKGTIATPFELRPYSVELQLCQRYYVQWNTDTTGYYSPIGMVYTIDTAQARVVLTCPTVLRTNVVSVILSEGTITVGGSTVTLNNTSTTSATLYCFVGGSNRLFTGAYIADRGFPQNAPTQITMNMTGGSGFSGGQAGFAFVAQNASKTLAVSCEL